MVRRIWRNLHGCPSGSTVWSGDLLVAGHTTSQDIDIEDPLGMTDGWIIVVNENGELVESLSVGGSADDFILSRQLR